MTPTAELQAAIKKTLHSASFGKFVAQAVHTAFAEAEPDSKAVVLPAPPLGRVRFSEGNAYRSYDVRSADGTREVHMQCERIPDTPQQAGTWYGNESRTDSTGRVWQSHIRRMTQDDFGTLVEIAA